MTDKALSKIEGAGAVLEQVVIQGDLSKLSPADRVAYYKQVCESVGLNPLTRPFDYIELNGKLTLYAKRDAADQLRKMHGVSVKVTSKEVVDGLMIVEVQATDRTGRIDEDMGAVNIAGLRGEAKANAMAKAVTKAKRRVTLSICGLGWLTDAEIDAIPSATPPKHDLDGLFPGNGGPGEAPAAIEGAKTPDVPEEKKAAPDAPQGPLLHIPFDDTVETYTMDNKKQWFEEYLKQLKAHADRDGIASRLKMTQLKALEAANKEGLDALPPAGKKKLIDWRKKLNRKLGAQAKKEKTDG